MPSPVPSWWGLLPAGALFEDEHGTPWRVLQRKVRLPQIALLCVNWQGETGWVTRGMGDAVTLLDESNEQEVADLRARYPGRRVRVLESLPPGPNRAVVRQMYKSHLLNEHGVGTMGDLEPLVSLIEAHALAHAEFAPGTVVHAHMPFHRLEAEGRLS